MNKIEKTGNQGYIINKKDFWENFYFDDYVDVSDYILMLIYRIFETDSQLKDARNYSVLEGLGKALTAEIDKKGKLGELMKEVEESENELDQFKAFFKVLGYEES